MERFHWVQHRCRQLLEGDSERGWYSAPDGLPNKGSLDAQSSSRRVSGKRRTVHARHGPHRQDYEAVSRSYKGNAIQTTKYSILTFIPMNLFQQFHRSDCYWCKSYKKLRKYIFFLFSVHTIISIKAFLLCIHILIIHMNYWFNFFHKLRTKYPCGWLPQSIKVLHARALLYGFVYSGSLPPSKGVWG